MPTRLLYVDESGNDKAYAPGDASASAAFIVAGITLPQPHLISASERLLQARRASFGHQAGKPLIDGLHKNEVKGATLRRGMIGQEGRRQRKSYWNYMDECVEILEEFNCGLFASIWLKAPKKSLDASGAYRVSLQHFASGFSHALKSERETGMMILDGRGAKQDEHAQRAIFDMKYGCEPDATPDLMCELIEVPTAGNSKHFGGLQLADTLVSGLIYPLAYAAYSPELGIPSPWDGSEQLCQSYGDRLYRLQCRWRDASRRQHGGFVVLQNGSNLDPRRLTQIHKAPRSLSPGRIRRSHARPRGRGRHKR
jgi:hypothetical protein